MESAVLWFSRLCTVQYSTPAYRELRVHDSWLRPNQTLVSYTLAKLNFPPLDNIFPEAGVLDEPDSAKPAQQSSYNGPPVPAYVGLARQLTTLYKARLKLPPLYEWHEREISNAGR